MDKNELKERTKLFALRVIRFAEHLPKTTVGIIIAKQIVRSGTSVAANYRASLRARSAAEFLSKTNIIVEEADETLFWLEIVMDANLMRKESVLPLYTEADELTAIFVATMKTLKKKG